MTPIPEWRLPEVIVGGVVFACGILYFGWAGYRPDTPWIAPTLSGLLIGFGIMSIFLQSLNYIVDAYLMVSSIPLCSALPALPSRTLVRPISCTWLYETALLTKSSSSPLLRLLQILSSVLCAAASSHFSPHTCLMVWV